MFVCDSFIKYVRLNKKFTLYNVIILMSDKNLVRSPSEGGK